MGDRSAPYFTQYEVAPLLPLLREALLLQREREGYRPFVPHPGRPYSYGVTNRTVCGRNEPLGAALIGEEGYGVLLAPNGQAPERRALNRALSEPEWDVEPELKARGFRRPSKLNEQRRILRLDDRR
jgi:hypothetical protein